MTTPKDPTPAPKKPAAKKVAKPTARSSAPAARSTPKTTSDTALKTTTGKSATTTGADKANLNAAKIINRVAKSSKKGGLIAKIQQRAPIYWRLMRMDRPIGTLLLLWPTLWSLWIAAKGVPSVKNLVIFVLGVIVMRAAGCVINDFADRDFDPHVERTRNRPLAARQVSIREALTLAAVLILCAFLLTLRLPKPAPHE